MPSFYRWEKEWQVKAAKRKVPEYLKEDLLEWQNTLKNFEPRRIIPDLVPIDLNWVGNASMTGIGVLVGRKWAQFDLVKGWNDWSPVHVKRNIAWAETVAIILPRKRQ